MPESSVNIIENKRLNKQTIRIVVRNILYYFVAALLLFSGIAKVIDPAPLMETLKAAFKLSSDINIISVTALSVIEIALAVMMLLQYRLNITLILVSILFILFFLFAVYGTIIGLNIDCGCFSDVVRSEFGINMILRNILLAAVSLWLVIENKSLPPRGINYH